MKTFFPNNPFGQVAEGLVNMSFNKKQTIKVPYGAFNQFKKEFVFDKLQGKRFGKAFCEKFGIDDYLLSNIKDDVEAESIIQLLGYLK